MSKSIFNESNKSDDLGVVDKIIAFAKSFSLRPVIFSSSCCTNEIEQAFSSGYSTIELSD